MRIPGISTGLSALRDALRTQLWPLPTLGLLLAVALGVGLPSLDLRVDDDLPPWLQDLLFGGDASAARTVLAAIAGSLMTVTSLTFSLTVVTLQLASSQFSPRLLRTFARDLFVQATLALFLATFTYALTVLRTVRTGDDQQVAFVPQLSVTLAFLLTLASVLGLVLFLAHLARQIRVETMLSDVSAEATATIRRLLPDREDAAPRLAVPTAPDDAIPLVATGSGFLVRVDEEALLAAAVAADAVVAVDRLPGSSLVAGTPLGAAWPRSGGGLGGDAWARLHDQVGAAVVTGVERTTAQDPGFGLRQITDVATKALSPGINDPTTAVHALGHTAALLCELTGRDLGPRLIRDDEDEVRAVLARPDFADLLEVALAQPRHYGAADPAVAERLLVLLREVGWCAREPAQREAVAAQLARVRRSLEAQDFDETERTRLAALAEAAARSVIRRAGDTPRYG